MDRNRKYSEPEGGPSSSGRTLPMLPELPVEARRTLPANPISNFKAAGNVVLAAKAMASDDWTQARRPPKTDGSRWTTRSAVLAHMQSRQRSNSVIAVPSEGRRSIARGPLVKQLSLQSLASHLGLSAAQKRAIEVSWERLESINGHKGAKSVLERAFGAFCNKQPAASTIFVSNSCVQSFSAKKTENSVRTLRDHAGFYTWFLGKVVEGLDHDATQILDQIKEIGKAHSSLAAIGFTTKMWDKLGQVLVEHLVVQEAVRHYPEATKAWTVLTASLIDRLCSAFVQECKRK